MFPLIPPHVPFVLSHTPYYIIRRLLHGLVRNRHKPSAAKIRIMLRYAGTGIRSAEVSIFVAIKLSSESSDDENFTFIRNASECFCDIINVHN